MVGLTGFTACEGDQGEMGPAGINGQDGRDGVDGQDGEDGNANVISIPWTDVTFGGFGIIRRQWFEIDDTRITQEVLDNYAVLGFIKIIGEDIVYSLPVKFPISKLILNNYLTLNTYTLHIDDEGSGPMEVPDPGVIKVRYVLIEATSMAPTGKSGHSEPSALQKMLDAGIDTTDYNAVAQYLNLE
ncbi:hypothetical protein B7P33_00055 [Sediminicola luteus]|uniref:Collagen-like protein n=2 Tax=Sediminicola luteus TaxID=319238 RepID=A0A2A4GD85_9FLAO|nr:hypothetical protein B7P33_00055 [Sediminicola luteus]